MSGEPKNVLFILGPYLHQVLPSPSGLLSTLHTPNSPHLGTFLITSKSLHPKSSVVHPSCLVGVLTSDGFLYYHDTFYLSVYVELGATAAVPCDSARLHNTKALSVCLLLKVYCYQVPNTQIILFPVSC